MKLLATIIDALHRSRRAHAEAVIRRYSHLVVEAREREREELRETAAADNSKPRASIDRGMRTA